MDYLIKLEKELNKASYNPSYRELIMKYTKMLVHRDVPVIYDISHLCLYLTYSEENINKIISNPEIYYKKKKIRSKKGKTREIYIPDNKIKVIQKWILENILYKIHTSKFAKGFIPRLSIFDNAIAHTNKKFVLNLDFKDFFDNIKLEQIYQVFKNIGYTSTVSDCLARLCSFNGILPQGAPSSPYISNLVCISLDKRLESYIINKNIDYSRYADDLTFSSNENLASYIDELKKIIEKENFKLNENKMRLQRHTERQIVTGLVVNSKVNIPRKYYRSLKQEIFYCKKYGVSAHMERRNIRYSNYKYHLYGKALYIKMINPEKGEFLIEELNTIKWQY